MPQTTRSRRRPRKPSKRLACPRGLTRAGRALWFDLRDHIDQFGIQVDGLGPRLEMLCREWGHYRKACEYCRRHGPESKHYFRASAALNRSWRTVSRGLKEFGGTPLSRARLARRGIIRVPA